MITTAAENFSGRWMSDGVECINEGRGTERRALTRIIGVDEV